MKITRRTRGDQILEWTPTRLRISKETWTLDQWIDFLMDDDNTGHDSSKKNGRIFIKKLKEIRFDRDPKYWDRIQIELEEEDLL